jgi:hypothetical protein
MVDRAGFEPRRAGGIDVICVNKRWYFRRIVGDGIPTARLKSGAI